MGRKKRGSRILEQAAARLSGLKSINPALYMGNGLSVAACEQALNTLRAKLDAYNQKLSELDEELYGLEAEEKKVSDLNGRILAGVAAAYGRDSSQYEAVGGVRTSDRKNSTRKPDSSPPTQT